MLTEERIDELTCKLSDDFDQNSNGIIRGDFAGAYVKNNILHIILVDNADIEHYKSILNESITIQTYHIHNFLIQEICYGIFMKNAVYI